MLRKGDGEWLYGDEWKIKIMVMANKNTIDIIIKKILIMYLNLNSNIDKCNILAINFKQNRIHMKSLLSKT